ncbi:MAG TPA: hypothetical protein PL064_01825, partial [Thermogutta sp.]|nr:hypothetical protein [Thermogutta sp.]
DCELDPEEKQPLEDSQLSEDTRQIKEMLKQVLNAHVGIRPAHLDEQLPPPNPPATRQRRARQQ